jgi:benzoyl-CoA 2,3-dioxygenase component B
MFTDRDGKYQLAALSQSGFDPLARSTEFMLTEEAHHLFVGETGLDRIIKRSAELQRLDPNGDVRNQGGIDFDLIQRTINYWFTYSLDLFGGEISSQRRRLLRDRPQGPLPRGSPARAPALDQSYRLPVVDGGRLVERDVPLRNAMNEVLRDSYITDCERALRKWNRTLEEAGSPTRLSLPSRRFHRHQGIYADHRFNPEGELVSQSAWDRDHGRWLLRPEDNDYLLSIMKPVYEPGKFANWIAPPNKGIEASRSSSST